VVVVSLLLKALPCAFHLFASVAMQKRSGRSGKKGSWNFRSREHGRNVAVPAAALFGSV
jgi:hypothetical protein